jgi:hypothetical protein
LVRPDKAFGHQCPSVRHDKERKFEWQ